MANNKSTVRIGAFEQKLQEMEAGITKVIPQGSTLVVERSPQTAAQMADRLKAYLQMFADVQDKKSQASQSIGALHQKLPEAHQYYMDLKTSLVAFFGRGSPELSQFGISVRSRKPLTSEQKAVAHAKALNTGRCGTPSGESNISLRMPFRRWWCWAPTGNRSQAVMGRLPRPRHRLRLEAVALLRAQARRRRKQ